MAEGPRHTQPVTLPLVSRPPARVGIAEDDTAQARLARRLVEDTGALVVSVVKTAEEAIALASQADILVLDFRLDGPMTGLDVLSEVRRRRIPVTVIVTTAHGSEQVAAEALRAGADDYVIKDAAYPDMLPRVLKRAIRMHDVEHALADAQERAIQAERRAAIVEITTALSHELNNPLMALSTQLELISLDAGALPAKGREALTGALEQFGRIAALVKRLSEVDHESSVPYAGTRRMTDLSEGGAS